MMGIVYIVDDDDAVRDSLDVLLRLRGYRTRPHASGASFLDDVDAAVAGCIVLDLRMPQLGGLDVLLRLRERAIDLPIVVLTAHGDAASARAAFKGGAFEFLEKPVDDVALVAAIDAALRAGSEAHALRQRRESAQQRLSRLTAREREVLELVVAGHHNREIAALLDISPRTVEVYKTKLLDKLQVERLPALIRMALEAGLTRDIDPHKGNP
jgi:RNA polymerase sigma factor (sigma-70 family)